MKKIRNIVLGIIGSSILLSAVSVVQPKDITILPINTSTQPKDATILPRSTTILPRSTTVYHRRATAVTKLYIATFNRAPDVGGLTYWINSNLTVDQIAQSFFDQPETKSLYPVGSSNVEFINSIYQNIFGRNPDNGGFTYWRNELDGGIMGRSVFILAVMNGALGDDAILLENKLDIGLTYVRSGSNDVDKAYSLMENISNIFESVSRTVCENNLVGYYVSIGSNRNIECGDTP